MCCIGDGDAAVDGVAGACYGDEEGLIGEERGGRGGDVARLRYRGAAHGEEIADGGEIKEVRWHGSVEDVGFAGGLVGCAVVAYGAW